MYSTNLAVPKERMEPAAKTIITFYEVPGGGPEPLRAWFYPGDQIGQEFVYPAKRMAEIRAAMGRGAVTLAENRGPEPASVAPPQTPSQSAEGTTADVAAPPQSPAPEAPEAQRTKEPPAEQPSAVPPSTPVPAETSAQEPSMPHTAGNTVGIGLFGLICAGLAAPLRIANRRLGSRS